MKRETPEEWSNAVAELAADALVDAKIIQREQFKLAVDVISEEIRVRLLVRDYPPPPEDK
jgi:hypothetical protein